MPQTDINHADIRTRFIFDDMPVRGLHVRLEANSSLRARFCPATLKTKARSLSKYRDKVV